MNNALDKGLSVLIHDNIFLSSGSKGGCGGGGGGGGSEEGK
jgi:hypothetical protein